MKLKHLFALSIVAFISTCVTGCDKGDTTTDDLPDEVDEYYSSIDPNSSRLLNDLKSLNNEKRKRLIGYDGLPALYKKSDADPKGSGKILGFYDNALIKPTWDSGRTWNREHVWPKSLGGDKVEDDAYMARPTMVSSNSDRGNKYYAASNAFDPGYEIPNYRGIAARIIFYCCIATGGLSLVDSNTGNADGKMGKLSDLLKWNLQYLPSTEKNAPVELKCEQNRNDVIEDRQGNRNPFVDHPEYACKIWGNTNSNTKKVCGIN